MTTRGVATLVAAVIAAWIGTMVVHRLAEPRGRRFVSAVVQSAAAGVRTE